MLKSLKHVPCDPKYVNQESLYLIKDKDGKWMVGGFQEAEPDYWYEGMTPRVVQGPRPLEFISNTQDSWSSKIAIPFGKLAEIYQMVVPRGFVREGFSKIKVKNPKRNKNQPPKPKKRKVRVIDLNPQDGPKPRRNN